MEEGIQGREWRGGERQKEEMVGLVAGKEYLGKVSGKVSKTAWKVSQIEL